MALNSIGAGHDVVQYCRFNRVLGTAAVGPNRQGQPCVIFAKGGPMCANHSIIAFQIKTPHAGRSIRAVGNRFNALTPGRAG